MGKLISDNLEIVFNKQNCFFQESKSDKVIGQGKFHGHTALDFSKWHQRLGNVSSRKLNHLVKANCLDYTELGDTHSSVIKSNFNKIVSVHNDCHICPLSKQTILKHPISLSKSNGLYDLIHIDIWGKSPIFTHDGFNFFLTIVEDFSKTAWTHLIPNKSMVLICVTKFINMVKNYFEKNIKVIRSDNGVNSPLKVQITSRTSWDYSPILLPLHL